MTSGIRCYLLPALGAALALTGGLYAASPSSPGSLVEFRFTRQSQLDNLTATGFYDIVQLKGDRAVAIRAFERRGAKRPASVEQAEAAVTGMTTLLLDVDEQLASFRKQGSEGAYHSYEETMKELRDLEAKYPDLLKTESIGRSHEGRELMAVRLSGPASPAADKPRVLLFGLTHAREWVSTELPLFVLNHLLTQYGKDPKTTALVDGLQIYILPILNPDGLQYSQTQYTMWRKNRSPQKGAVGVDVNRNFPIGFGLGSSNWPSSDVYRGTEPASELETKALLALYEREKFVASLSFHSYSELVLYPWGHDRALPPDSAELARRGKAMADLNRYTAGQVSRILYIAGGGSDDTFYKNYGSWAFTFELGEEFVPPETEIKPICERNLPAVLKLLEMSLDTRRATPRSRGACTRSLG